MASSKLEQQALQVLPGREDDLNCFKRKLFQERRNYSFSTTLCLGLGVASSFVFTPVAGAAIGLSCDLGTSTVPEMRDIARKQVNCERSLELFSSNQVNSEETCSRSNLQNLNSEFKRTLTSFGIEIAFIPFTVMDAMTVAKSVFRLTRNQSIRIASQFSRRRATRRAATEIAQHTVRTARSGSEVAQDAARVARSGSEVAQDAIGSADDLLEYISVLREHKPALNFFTDDQIMDALRVACQRR